MKITTDGVFGDELILPIDGFSSDYRDICPDVVSNLFSIPSDGLDVASTLLDKDQTIASCNQINAAC